MAVVPSNSFTLIVNPTQTGTKLAFAHSQDVSISTSVEMIEATLSVSNGWIEQIPGKKTTTVSFSGLQDHGTITNRYNIDDLTDFFLDNDRLYFNVGVGGDYLMGYGFVSEISLESGVDDVATYSGTFTIISEVTTEIDVETDALRDSSNNIITDDFGIPITIRR